MVVTLGLLDRTRKSWSQLIVLGNMYEHAWVGLWALLPTGHYTHYAHYRHVAVSLEPARAQHRAAGCSVTTRQLRE